MKYIGLDMGTSGCKGGVFDQFGTQYATASQEYALEFPAPGLAELDPNKVWNAVVDVLRQLAPSAQDVKAMAVSTIGETMVLLDEHDQPLVKGIVYLDQRCSGEMTTITEKISQNGLFQIALTPFSQIFSLSRILWYQRHMPQVLKSAKRICLFGDFFTYRLCGKAAIDPATASRTMFFDAVNQCWSQELGDLFDIPLHLFSQVVPIGTNLGTILPEIAVLTGLSSTLEVIVGTHDQVTTTLGAGALQPGHAVLGQGTSESLNTIVHKDQLITQGLDSGFGYEPYVTSDLYIISSSNLFHGACINWFVQLFAQDYEAECQEDESLFQTAGRLCASDAQGIVFLPSLSTASMDATSQSVPGGFLGVTLSTDRDCLYRGLLEGLSCATKSLICSMEAYDMVPTKITATGGASKSPLLMQMKSDFLQQPIHVLKHSQTGILGLVMICAVACGDFPDHATAAKQLASLHHTYHPLENKDHLWQPYEIIKKALQQR